MKKYNKILIGIFLIAGLFYLYYSDLTPGTKTALLVGVFLVYLFYNIEKRFRRVESALRLLEDPTKKEEALKPLSYKVRVYINIEWLEIIKNCFPNLKTDEQTRDFVEDLYKDSNLKINKTESLFQKSFSFVVFNDGLSGIHQIWSDHHKTFVDDLEVKGDVFSGGFLSALFNKFPENKIIRQFFISPEFIGFRSDLPDGYMMDEDKISQIPFFDIINFFKKVHKNIDFMLPMYAVKKFPQELQKKIDKYNVKYESYGSDDYFNKELIESEWAKENNVEIYDQMIDSHLFSTPYYSLSIQIEIFD